MKNLKFAGIALLIGALPMAPAAFAHEQDHDRHEHQRPVRHGEHEEHGRDWGHGHHHDRYYGHDDRRYYHRVYRDDDDYEIHVRDDDRIPLVLPFPPIPPLPRIPAPIVPGLHNGHLVLRPLF